MEVVEGSIGLSSTQLGDPRWRKGGVHEVPGLRITILDTDRTGLTRIEFKFDKSLTDDSYRFLAWREGSLESVDIPPVGGSILVN